ncbi:hypothetical protein Glove_212g219 [Diversispora epigaea]|uniref:Restriction endonuclease domain-containing protein n=1 Tax=Diversispora epigaea TaxID=1348612 RepID=A0A397ISP7_9GLOM|nr:hypothetical protein Glove_212g219 [Diversispora epigaea]
MEKPNRSTVKLVDSVQDITKDKTKSKVIKQIENEIKIIMGEVRRDVDILEIDMPSIKANKREKVLEAIHNIFQAERIDDKLFIKCDGLGKEEIHRTLGDSLRPQLLTWTVETNVICVVNGNEFRPDVGGWNRRPTRPQRFAPIINSCPPPFLWIEVAFNKNDDRNNAINKIAYVQPYCPNTEFVIIIIPFGTTAFPANKNPDAISIVATPRSDRPFRAPYLGHLAVGNNIDTIQWYNMQWNQHHVLGCGANIHFNDVFDLLT